MLPDHSVNRIPGLYRRTSFRSDRMAGIQDGDLIYLRAVVGLPYEYLVGDSGAGTVQMNDVIGNPNTQWIARLRSDRVWTLECQHDNGVQRYLDIDADLEISMDDDPSDASTHWTFVPTTTPGRWQIRSHVYGYFLNGGERIPTGTTYGDAVGAHWELLIIAQ
jgi:hypothetical protein